MLAISDEQIDQQVERFRVAADASTTNLLELESLETLQLVRATTFTGATALPAAEALAALERLLVLQPRLTDFADRLEQLRDRVPRARGDQLQRFEDLLGGPSITLPSRQIELDDRSLFTPAEVSDHVTANALIATMNDLFVRARSTLLAIDDVWHERLSQITALGQQVTTGLARAAQLGEPNAELAALDDQLSGLVHELATDPLGTAGSLDAGVADRVAAISRHLDAVDELRRDLPGDLRAAAGRLSEIVRLADESERAADEALAGIAGLHVPRLDRAALHDERTGLIPWLQRLVDLSEAGRWRAARVGLDRWLAAADTVSAMVARSHAASTAALERRRELRLLLDSYRSVAGDAFEQREELGRLYGDARASLYDAPVDLAGATEHVRRFLEAVRSGS